MFIKAYLLKNRTGLVLGDGDTEWRKQTKIPALPEIMMKQFLVSS